MGETSGPGDRKGISEMRSPFVWIGERWWCDEIVELFGDFLIAVRTNFCVPTGRQLWNVDLVGQLAEATGYGVGVHSDPQH
jgi:hypothetical protein